MRPIVQKDHARLCSVGLATRRRPYRASGFVRWPIFRVRLAASDGSFRG
jgi:hypothetical protein